MLTLYIGTKNYSSWSLRPWLAMRHAGIAFEERKLTFGTEAFAREVARVSPAGTVPVLVDGDFAIWDSLAIVEYVAELAAAQSSPVALWPADRQARARARSVCAEMHAGFRALRTHMQMNVTADDLAGRGWDDEAVRRDIARICDMWTGLRSEYGARGPFLFGTFSIADAYFAPVVFRFRTYAPPLPDSVHAYMETMLALPAMREWESEARTEPFLQVEEPYRRR
jgi:glutathione S-transferase